jgi:hypothetical protein
MTAVLIATVTVFLLAALGMAVGVMATGRCLRGSCGGPEVLDARGEPLSCATCPNRTRRRQTREPAE